MSNTAILLLACFSFSVGFYFGFWRGMVFRRRSRDGGAE